MPDPRVRHISYASSSMGWPARVFTAVAGVVLLVLGFMFSVALFGVVLLVGLCLWSWLWWKTREARKLMADQRAAAQNARAGDEPWQTSGGRVFEGEVVRDDESGTSWRGARDRRE